MELWNNTTTLEKAATFTPYVFIVLGALVAASGIYLKGVIEKRIDTLVEATSQERKNTPPEMRVVLGTATSRGKDHPGRTLLEIRCENEIPFNARWLVVTREDRLVSPFMTAPMKIVPEGTPIFKTPIQINAEKVVDDYIELRFTYDSIHSPQGEILFGARMST